MIKEDARIPKKPGQPDKSDKHSDLYTDEDPKDTIHGLKFATRADASASVSKIKSSGRSHAHKIQAAVAMEQRAKQMGKTDASGVYRSFINSMKKKTEQMKEDVPTNAVAGGAVAGLGVPNSVLPNQAEPGIKRKKFAGSTVFKVPTKSFVMAKMLKRKGARFESYLGDAVVAKEISEYASANWKEGIVLEDELTGAMCYLRYGSGN